MISSTYSCDFFRKGIVVCKLHTVLLPDLLRPNFLFIACVDINISSKELHTKNYFHGKSFNHIHYVICRPRCQEVSSMQVSN